MAAGSVASDAAWYAQTFDVSDAEAERRLILGDLAGQLDATLSAEQRETFAGLWIVHEPDFLVEVRMLPGTEDQVWKYVDDAALAEVLRVTSRSTSIVQLREEQESLHGLVPSDVDFASGIDIGSGLVRAEVSEEDLPSMEGIPFPEHAYVTTAGSSAPLEIFGGLGLSNGCTSGFSVREIEGDEKGISTAAHCPDSVTWEGTTLPLVDAQRAGSLDLQWHSTPGIADPPKFDSGIDTRQVLTVWSRGEQAVNDAVCKNGAAGGYACGILEDKWYDPSDSCVPNSSADWMLAYQVDHPDGFVVKGDSGGPIFKNNGARGTIACGKGFVDEDDDDAPGIIYVAPNFFHELNVRVIIA